MSRLLIGILMLTVGGVGVWFLRKQPVNTPVVTVKPPIDQSSDADQGPEETSLEEVLGLARRGLRKLETEITSYSARMTTQEQVNGTLSEASEMLIKVQNPGRDEAGKPLRPMRVYLKYTAPASKAGREVIWAEDLHDAQLVVHEGGLLGMMTLRLDPKGMLAMRGNRHSIDHIGLAHLTAELIERGEGALNDPGIKVVWSEGHQVGKRPCRMVTITSPSAEAKLGFYKVEIAIDMQEILPLHYAAFDWPKEAGGEPILLESYTYEDLVLEPGFTDLDFDPTNPAYTYPKP